MRTQSNCWRKKMKTWRIKFSRLKELLILSWATSEINWKESKNLSFPCWKMLMLTNLTFFIGKSTNFKISSIIVTKNSKLLPRKRHRSDRPLRLRSLEPKLNLKLRSIRIGNSQLSMKRISIFVTLIWRAKMKKWRLLKLIFKAKSTPWRDRTLNSPTFLIERLIVSKRREKNITIPRRLSMLKSRRWRTRLPMFKMNLKENQAKLAQ